MVQVSYDGVIPSCRIVRNPTNIRGGRNIRSIRGGRDGHSDFIGHSDRGGHSDRAVNNLKDHGDRTARSRNDHGDRTAIGRVVKFSVKYRKLDHNARHLIPSVKIVSNEEIKNDATTKKCTYT
ncbi:unnamed protein product [Chrysodeixis includens]|uniref:Uncharacterized protein n=1 Tax=Chrysodeixis includens TaxID=689277 RepID=A0A9N8PY37_CHRIL|nr:unnamed protein product [Chrysodeixis includens]